jgi:short-subunit dehydrogenase
MSKHAVVGLTTSLRIEAAPLGIRVSALCPGVIRTAILDGGGKFGKSLDVDGGKAQKAVMERYNPMDPAEFAVAALKQIAANKALIVIPSRWKKYWWAARLSPSLGMFLAGASLRSDVDEQPKAASDRREPVQTAH